MKGFGDILPTEEAAQVQPITMDRKQEEEEEEDQVGNGQPDDCSFGSSVCSSFLLSKRQDRYLDFVGDETLFHRSGSRVATSLSHQTVGHTWLDG